MAHLAFQFAKLRYKTQHYFPTASIPHATTQRRPLRSVSPSRRRRLPDSAPSTQNRRSCSCCSAPTTSPPPSPDLHATPRSICVAQVRSGALQRHHDLAREALRVGVVARRQDEAAARRRVGAVVWHDEAAARRCGGASARRHGHDGAAVPKGTTRHGQAPVGSC